MTEPQPSVEADPFEQQRPEFETHIKRIAVEHYRYSSGDAMLKTLTERNRNGRYAVEWVQGAWLGFGLRCATTADGNYASAPPCIHGGRLDQMEAQIQDEDPASASTISNGDVAELILAVRTLQVRSLLDASGESALLRAPMDSAAGYLCGTCGQSTPPPAPYKAIVTCQCGAVTPATVARSISAKLGEGTVYLFTDDEGRQCWTDRWDVVKHLPYPMEYAQRRTE